MTDTRSADTVHREIVLEDHLVAQLVREQGYIERSPEEFDRDLALDRELVLRFVQETQPEAWKKAGGAIHVTAPGPSFSSSLKKGLKDRGTLDLLRRGFKMIPNINFSLLLLPTCVWPEPRANPAVRSQYPECHAAGALQPKERERD